MLRMIVPRTSVCPVAVTVLGIPTAWKTPCASNEPGVRSMKNKTIPKNLDFISTRSSNAQTLPAWLKYAHEQAQTYSHCPFYRPFDTRLCKFVARRIRLG